MDYSHQRQPEAPDPSRPDARQEPVLVSVIIPARNAAAGLPHCLQALAASDYPRLEVIVVSDASVDATDDIARAHGARVIRNDTSCGAAYARNVGASVANGDIFFFVDADAVLNSDAVSIAVECLGAGAADAAFGSYLSETRIPNFTTKFKNYQHHFNHQIGSEAPISFWSGCGAVTRTAFLALEGFDVGLQFCEDIEFGHALDKAGYRVRLLKHMQAEHLKPYSLRRLLRSDLLGRAIPWTRLLRSGRSRMGTLNTGRDGVLSVVMTAGIWACTLASPWFPLFVWGAAAALAGLLGLNRHFLLFLSRKRGLTFAAASVLLLLLHFTICGLGYVGAHFKPRYPSERTPAPEYAFTEELKVSRAKMFADGASVRWRIADATSGGRTLRAPVRPIQRGAERREAS